MKKQWVVFTITIALFLSLSSIVKAASVPDGAIIIRPDDGASSRCINATTDKVSIHLRRISLSKDIGWFTEDVEVGIKIDTTLEGTTEQQVEKITFPRIFKTTVRSYAEGIVSLPIELKLINNFSLSTPTVNFDSIGIEFVILKKKSKNNFGVALSALEGLSKQLPLPANPYSVGFKYFTEYANTVVNESLNENNNVKETLKEGGISLAFSATDSCTMDQEKTGTIVVIKGFTDKDGKIGNESNGYVDIKKNYCWRVTYRPGVEIKFANLPTGTYYNTEEACKKVTDDQFRSLNNPFYAFVVVAIPKKSDNIVKATKGIETTQFGSDDHDINESLKRCVNHGISADNCF